MKLRLQPGSEHLSHEGKRLQALNLRKANDIFTSPEIEALLEEIAPKPLPLPVENKAESPKHWFSPIIAFLSKFFNHLN